MKKFITAICAALVCCFMLSATVTEAKTATYQKSVTKDNRNVWTSKTSKIYLNKARTKLCEKNIKTGKVTVLKTLKATEDTYFTLENVDGNYIYMNRVNYLSSDVYVFNKATKKLKKVKSSLWITENSGKYMLAIGYIPSDQTPYTAWIYKTDKNSVKKVKTLGTSVMSMRIIDGTVYYAVDSKENMKVYSSSLNGKKKLLYTKAIETDSTEITVEEITKDHIDFVEYDYNVENSSKEYRYDFASGELQELSK